jgi:hypothetical protein
MNNDTMPIVMALSEISGALIVGLKTSVEIMENWDELTPQKKVALIETIKKLITHGEKVFNSEKIKGFNKQN